jgi:hypothetical protein
VKIGELLGKKDVSKDDFRGGYVLGQVVVRGTELVAGCALKQEINSCKVRLKKGQESSDRFLKVFLEAEVSGDRQLECN